MIIEPPTGHHHDCAYIGDGDWSCDSECPSSRTSKVYQIYKGREMVNWMAQTLHQAYHQDQEGTFEECPRDTCKSATDFLRLGAIP